MVGDTVSAVVSEIHDWNQNKKEKKNLKTNYHLSQAYNYY